MVTRRKMILGAGAALALPAFATATAARAASAGFPAGPVRMVVPYPPGGPTDTLARIVAQRMGERMGQTVLVDYQPGAGTAIGVTQVARSPADGHTIGIVNSAFVINPLIRKSMTYEVDQLTGVTQLVYVPLVLAANADAPFDTLEELVAHARANPGTLSFATPGAGGTSHLAGELLNRVAGIDLLHIAYKGSAPAHTDVVGGRVPLLIDPLLSVMPMVEAGRLKIIAILSAERFPSASQYPTAAETYPGFDVSTFLGLVAPAGTPASAIDTLAGHTVAVLQEPETRSRIEELGMGVVGSDAAAFNRLIAAEEEQWRKVIADADITLE